MTNYYETERLILREVLESDIETMFELDSNTLVHRYLGNNPFFKKERINWYELKKENYEKDMF